MVKIKQLWTTRKKEMILYIWKWWLQYNKSGGMGLVIKELTHPYSLAHKDYQKKKKKG